MLTACSSCARRPTAWRQPLVLTLLLLPCVARAVSGSDDDWVWRGVYEDDGPPYSHVDLASVGGLDLSLGTGDSATVTLPFTFPFYGTDYSQITVHSYGVVSMGAGTNAPGSFAAAGGCIADGTFSDAFIAPLWDDWDLDLGGQVLYQTWTDAIWVQWSAVYRDASSSSTQDFGVWLHASGEIELVYDDSWGGDASSSWGRLGAIGLQAGTSGVSLGCQEGTVQLVDDGITFTPWGLRHLAGTMLATDWADATVAGTGGSDRLGQALVIAGDLTGDGVADLVVGAPYDDDGASNAGAAWLFAGGEGFGGALTPDDADVAFLGASSGDQLGYALHGGGDLNGDGVGDLAIGAPYGDDSARDEGIVALFFGGTLSGSLSAADADTLMWGDASGDTAGSSVAIVGDVDGDGYDDLLIGAPTSDLAGSDAGAVYLFTGTPSWVDSTMALSDATLVGEAAGDSAGYRVAPAGDIDGDDLADLLVGAYGVDDGGIGAGAAYVVPAADLGIGTTSLGTHHALLGATTGDAAGLGVAPAGDPWDLGYDAIFVGAYGAGSASQGAVYLQSGPPVDYPSFLSSADRTIAGADADRLGFAMAAITLDDGGPPGLAAGAYGNYDGASSGGSVFLFHGDDLVDGSASSVDDAWGQLVGEQSSGFLGAAVDAGDLDGDGYDDLAAGAWGATGDAASSGVVYVVLGRPGYPDGDGDGFMAVEHGGVDCDDSDDAVSPAEAESCDGIDNDCDGSVDEDWGDSDGDGVADCLDSEECDGVDNDGDGDIDEAMPDTDGDGTCDALDSEDCDGIDNDGDGDVDEDFSDTDTDGIADCMDVEECDGLDNDGDGTTDEGYTDTDHDGRADCVDWESCDGLDNDGDGEIDEGFEDTDGDGTPDCTDDEECDGIDNDGDGEIDEDMPDSDGDGTCDALDAETCDGIDNDGDGHVDEGYADTDGDGTPDCLDSEDCDGIDNDGDGSTDEGFTDTDGDGTADCMDEEECDGVDNDGDGYVDEGYPDTDHDGTPDCRDTEHCDGLDNDGDGDVDEGYTDTDGDGAADCIDVEECDGVDNDGDGLADEGFEDSDGDGVADCIDHDEEQEDTGEGEPKGCSAAGGHRGSPLMLLLPALLIGRRRWTSAR
jgi:hypothetical protein